MPIVEVYGSLLIPPKSSIQMISLFCIANLKGLSSIDNDTCYDTCAWFTYVYLVHRYEKDIPTQVFYLYQEIYVRVAAGAIALLYLMQYLLQ